MKSLSPLISAVLLIAFAVSISVIIKTWFENISRESAESIGSQTEKRLLCSRGSISLLEVKFCNSYLSGKIENSGEISLGNISLLLIYSSGSENLGMCRIGLEVTNCTEKNLTLIPMEKVSFNLSVSPGFEEIRILTNCTDVYDEVESGDVLFC